MRLNRSSGRRGSSAPRVLLEATADAVVLVRRKRPEANATPVLQHSELLSPAREVKALPAAERMDPRSEPLRLLWGDA